MAVLDQLKGELGADEKTAKRLGVSVTTVSRWRNGWAISAENWRRVFALAQATGATNSVGSDEVMRRYVEARNRLESIFVSGAEDNLQFVERVLRLLTVPQAREREGEER